MTVKRWAIVAVLAASVCVQLLTLRQGVPWGDDWSMYVMHARNLAEGRPYAATGYIVNPNQAEIGPTTYPPVFPLLLAPVYKVAGQRFLAFKLEQILFLLITIAIVMTVFFEELPVPAAIVASALFALNPYLAECKNYVASDLPFLMLCWSVYLLARRSQAAWAAPDADPSRRFRWVWTGLLGLFMYATLACRTIGGVWFLVLPAFDLIRTRRVKLPTIAAIGLAGVLAVGQAKLLGGGEASYVNQFDRHFGYLVGNAREYTASMRALWSIHVGAVDSALMLLLDGLAIVGLVKRVRGGITLLDLFAVAYLGIVIAWPAVQAPRLLIPLIPAYIIWIATGIGFVADRLRGARRLALAAFAAVLFLVYGAAYARGKWGPIPGYDQPAVQDLFAFVRRGTPEDAVIVFRKPRVLALYTGRRVSAYHETRNDDELWAYMRKIGASYLVVNRRPPEDARGKADADYAGYIQWFAEHDADRLRVVYENDMFRVFALNGAPTPEPQTAAGH